MYFQGYRIRKLSSTPLWFAVIEPTRQADRHCPKRANTAKALIQRKQEARRLRNTTGQG